MKLLIRADGDTRIGTGHVMRCLALAQAWPGEVTFLSRLEAPSIVAKMEAAGFAHITPGVSDGSDGDAAETIALAAREGAGFIVADGYHFVDSWQARVHAAQPLLVIDDDIHSARYSAALILNQNLHAESLEYPRAPSTRQLLGPRFALLRQEFWSWREWQRTIAERTRRILITLGGSDEDNVTARVMRAVARLDGVIARVLVGAANPHAAELAQLAEARPGRFDLVTASDRMPDEMAAADLAVSAGGSTCWELAFMGLPSVVITLAPNQESIGPSLAARGVCVAVGRHQDLDEAALATTIDALARDLERRREMSARGRQLVDGRGAERVVAAMLELAE